MRRFLFFLALYEFPFCAFAATETWTGLGGDNNWSTANNWSLGRAPISGDAIVFDGSMVPSPNFVNLDFTGTFTPASITFSNSIDTEFSGTGVFSVGSPSCPQLIFNNSDGVWLSGTTLNMNNGDLRLASTGTAQFATVTGTVGNLTVDPGVTANFTAPNTTLGPFNKISNNGIININAQQALPVMNWVMGNTAQLNLNGTSLTMQTVSGHGTISLSTSDASGALTIKGNLTYSGVIQDGIVGVLPGTVIISTFGTVTLSGANTYSGGTLIDQGFLEISDPSNLGAPNNSSYLVNLVGLGGTSNHSVLKPTADVVLPANSGLGIYLQGSAQFDLTSASLTVSCPISGPATLISFGSHTLTITSQTTYAGGTALQGGTLALSGSGSLPPTGTVNLSSGTTFDISALSSPTTSIIGPLTGSGNVSLGANTLEISSGSTDTTFSGSLTDGGSSGGLIKTGTATLSLIGANNYLGSTQVNNGTLVVGVGGVGSLANSPVTVNNGATLKGTGTITGSVTVGHGGTISGGNSIGTLTLGSLTLTSGSPGSNLTLEINSAGDSTIYDVTTTASLAGNLAITVDRGVYQEGTVYTFITTEAFGRSGQFNTITSNTHGSSTLTGRIDYGTNFVQLVLITPIFPMIPTNGLFGNAKAVADYLNEFASNPSIQPILLTIGGLATDQAQMALDSISPARNAISSWTAQNTLFGVNQVAVNRMLQQRYLKWIDSHSSVLAALPELEEELLEFEDEFIASKSSELPNKKLPPHGKAQTGAKQNNYYAVWAEGLGLFANQNAIHENPKYNSSTGCGLIGADFYDFKQGQMGFSVGYAQSSIDESGTGNGAIQYYLAGLYGTMYHENIYAELGLWGSFDQFHNERKVVYPGFKETAKSHHNGWQLVPHVGGGYDLNFLWGAIEPFVSFDAAVLWQQGYNESGLGVLDMQIPSSTSWLLRAEAGLNAYQIRRCMQGYIIFRETLSYVNLAPFGLGKMAGAALVGFPPGFTVTSFTDVQNMIAPGFEVFFKSNGHFFFSLAYQGEFTIGPGNYMSNEGIGKIGWFF